MKAIIVVVVSLMLAWGGYHVAAKGIAVIEARCLLVEANYHLGEGR